MPLIDRQAVLKNIEKIRQSVQMMDDTHRASIIMNGMYLCEKAVRNQPSAQPEIMKWIPCSERLPAYGEDVLISIGGYCDVGHIVSVNEEERYNWYFSGWYHLPNDVDAWMPLPEPWRGEDE